MAGQPLPLGARKQRAVLAMLALEANRPVSADRLSEGLWGESLPPSAGKMVQLYISQLRKALDGQDVTITTRARGYELACSPEDVDLVRAERLVAAATEAAEPNGYARAALELWRGPPLADIADEPFAAAEIRRCEELWLRAKELAIDADLAAGRHEDALREVMALANELPLQEHVQAQLMLALYRAGRQTEALEVFRRTRARLVEEIGSEPGTELRRLHEQMLQQSPELDPPAPERTPRARGPDRPRRRWLGIGLAAGTACVVLAVAGALWLSRDSEPAIGEDSVALLDARSGSVRTTYSVGRAPTAVVRGAGSTWVANGVDGTVTRVERSKHQVVTIDVGPHPGALAFGSGSLWVAGEGRDVAQLDPASNRIVHRIDVGGHPTALAVGYGALWVAQPREGVVVKVDLTGRRKPQRLAAGAGPAALAVGAGAVWVAAEDSGQLVRLTPGSGQASASINVGNGPAGVAVGEGAVWVANRPDGTISRVDPASGTVAGTLKVGSDAAAVAVAGGSVWVADAVGKRLVQVEPAGGRVAAKIPIASSPSALAGGGSLWVAAGAQATGHRGGRLVVESIECLGTCLDPSAGFGQALESLTLVYDGLLGYRRAPGTAGEGLVGALARSVPKPPGDGRTYVFTLRPGLRFSDGRPVRPTDVRASLERAVPLSRETLPGFFSSLEGADACARAQGPCDLSRSIQTDDGARTVTIRLRRPEPTFLHKLATVTAAVVPAGTPLEPGPKPPIGTGPYRFASIEDGQGSSHARAQPALPLVVGRGPARRVRGQDRRPAAAGWRQDGGHRRGRARHERPHLAQLRREPEPRAAQRPPHAVPEPVAVAPQLATDFMFLNVREPPFDDVRVRRAVNLATDRARMVDLCAGTDGAPSLRVSSFRRASPARSPTARTPPDPRRRAPGRSPTSRGRGGSIAGVRHARDAACGCGLTPPRCASAATSSGCCATWATGPR